MTVAQALDEGAARLSCCRPRTPRLDAEVLLAHVLESNRTRLYVEANQVLADTALERYRGLLAFRERGIPVAYLVGYRDFYSRRFEVSPDVLIPRPETETLVEVGLEALRRSALTRPRVLDLGTGSGIVAATLALERPGAEVVAVELEPDAGRVATRNFRNLRTEVQLLLGDLFDPVEGRFDLIVSNPPYVGLDCGPQPEKNVRDYEPFTALFGGRTGREILERIVTRAPDFLVEGGVLALELAPHQSEGVEALMIDRGFRHTRLVADLAGLPRVVAGSWEETRR